MPLQTLLYWRESTMLFLWYDTDKNWRKLVMTTLMLLIYLLSFQENISEEHHNFWSLLQQQIIVRVYPFELNPRICNKKLSLWWCKWMPKPSAWIISSLPNCESVHFIRRHDHRDFGVQCYCWPRILGRNTSRKQVTTTWTMIYLLGLQTFYLLGLQTNDSF